MDEHYISETIGAINTYIYMINDSSKWELEGKQIINLKWHYKLTERNSMFIARLKVNGIDEFLYFSPEEWKCSTANVLGNKKLKNLYYRLT